MYRNKLIHGDPLPEDLFLPLFVAEKNLEYILQRAVVGLLDWDVKRTRIDPASLRANHIIEKIPASQAQLGQYINNQE